jgi:DNA-binding HxlR family transcriptional regulator
MIWYVKSYSQYCPVAHALDLVGERWALLIVRELMLGQRRYTDLAEALPKIGTNILAARLRDLEAGGIVRKTKLPPPAAVSVYELTEAGRALDPVLGALAHWGALTMGPPQPTDCWSMYAVQARFRPDRAVDGSYEIRFDDESAIALRVDGGHLTASRYTEPDPGLAVQVEPGTLHELIEGMLTVPAALAAGRATLLAGTPTQLANLVGMFAPVAGRPADALPAPAVAVA